MTTGDEEAESLVDNLFREVDDQFKDLEREYSQAREELAVADTERRGPVDPLEASNERFELLSQVASLQAEVSRQADELDERDRMLAETGEKIAGFQSDIAERDEMLRELHEAKQAALDERREQARLQSLLDARAAERQELADVAHRLQNERDHIQELLEQSLERTEQAEAARVELDDKMRHLEAARDTAAHEHDARAHELIESRAEMSKLSDRLDEMATSLAIADDRAEKADALAERRANEAGYLSRRIDALTEKLSAAEAYERTATELRRDLNRSERKIAEIERSNASLQAELEAANAAVEAIASRTADYDELVTQVGTLQTERDEAWEAASGYTPAPAPAQPAPVVAAVAAAPAVVESQADEVASLADRARELGARRANEAEAAAEAAEAAAQLAAAEQEGRAQAQAERAEEPEQPGDALVAEIAAEPLIIDVSDLGEPSGTDDTDELLDLEQDDVDVIESDLAELNGSDKPEAPPPPKIPRVEVPVAQVADVPPPPAAELTDTSELLLADIAAAAAEAGTPLEDAQAPPQVPEVDLDAIPRVSLDHLEADDQEADLGLGTGGRKRTILPADFVPNTEEAVSFLLAQPGVTAIVDARSTCGRTGIRPSELFDRVAALRDHFDVPVEVVVTPVSTPVGGAPDLPAIGVHHVTGADTVADRVRALCMGLPPDQPLVVVAGDDHVRRAAIGEEANVVEPSAVLNLVE